MDKKTICIDMSYRHTPLDWNLAKILSRTFRVLVFAPRSKLRQRPFSELPIQFFPKMETGLSTTLGQKITNYRTERQNIYKLQNIIREERVELLLVTTLFNQFYALLLPKVERQTKTLFFVHNIDAWTRTQLHTFSRLHVFLKHRALKKAQGLFYIHNYVKQNGDRLLKKPGFVFPYRLSSYSNLEKREKFLQAEQTPTFALCGSNPHRIPQILPILRTFESIEKPFHLVLLGKNSAPEIPQNGTRLGGGTLTRFENYLSEEEYEQWLQESHFALGLFQQGRPYGSWMASGIEFDTGVNAVPFIVPEQYVSPNPDVHFLSYQTPTQLREILLECIGSVQDKRYQDRFFHPAREKALHSLENTWEKNLLDTLEAIFTSHPR